MDIFRVLVDYNMRTMQEVVVSSLLNYLLNPNEDHGLGMHFAEQFFLSCGLAPKGLGEVADWRGKQPPTIHIIPEWGCGEDADGNGLGRLDSLVILKKGGKAWIYGIEVKIHAQSARNENTAGTQLARYAKALDKFREKDGSLQELLNDESIILPDRIFVERLIYVVPGVTKVWPSFVQRALKESNDLLGGMLKIITWHKIANPLPREIENFNCPATVEDVLNKILLESQRGEIPPPDESTLHMLRCLRYALRSDFTYDYKLRRRFPDNGTFRDALCSNGQLVVLEWIQEIVRAWTGKKHLFAQSHHTCIGIPFKSGPQRGSNNTLCRIQTVESYLDPETIRNGIYIELSERNGWVDKKDILVLFKEHPELEGGSLGLTFALQDGVRYHQNGKDNERVFVVSIRSETSTPSQSDIAKNQLKIFFDALSEKFEATHGITRE